MTKTFTFAESLEEHRKDPEYIKAGKRLDVRVNMFFFKLSCYPYIIIRAIRRKLGIWHDDNYD